MELLTLLQVQQKKGSVGTLLLGERMSFREIFFEKDQVYLCGDRFSGKYDPGPLVEEAVLGNALSLDELEALIARTDLTQELLATTLLHQALIDQAKHDRLVVRQLREEVLELMLQNGDTFHFQEQRVPERLLHGGGLTSRISVPIDEVTAAFEDRVRRLESVRAVLPSRREIFVVTAEGMAQLQGASNDPAQQKIFSLVDGFRDLGTLIGASHFYDVLVLERVREALDAEHLKKTVLPEIKEVRVEDLDEAGAREKLPLFKNAVRHAADELLARERLAQIYEKLSQPEDAVVQYNFMGDALYRMRKPAKAISVYQRALSLRPGDVMVTDKITRIYQNAADQELLKNETDQAVRLLENALAVRPDDAVVFQRLVEILTREKRLKHLTELCDRTIAHSKNVGDPEIGINACRKILAVLPGSPLFRKKLINVHLDFAQMVRAAEEMAQLARVHVERGHTERALDLAEKIRRLKTGGPEVQRIWRGLAEELGIGKVHRQRNVLVVLLALLMLTLLGAYQWWSRERWRTTVRPVAHAAQAQPEPRGLLQSSKEERFRELALRCDAFVRQFPISLWRGRAAKLARMAKQERSRLEDKRQAKKQRILDQASLHALEGDLDAVRATAAPLLALDPEDPVRRKVEKLLEKVRNVEHSADELYRQAAGLERRGRWRDAWRGYLELKARFPESRRVRDLRLPILVESVPPGATLYRLLRADRKEKLGKTPLVLRIAPDDRLPVELAREGHWPVDTEIGREDGDLNQFVLERRPQASVAQPGGLSVRPVLDGKRLILGDRQGSVRALEPSGEDVAWRVTRGRIHWLPGSPLVCDEGVYFVWNDRCVVLREHEAPEAGGEPVKRASARLEGLARTAAVALPDGTLVLGTNRKALRVFSRITLLDAGEIPLEDVARTLAPLGRSSVIVGLVSGPVLALDVKTGNSAWRKRLVRPPARPPVQIRDSVVMVTAERDLLVLDAESGLPRAVEALGTGRWATPDPGSGTLWVVDRDGTVSLRSGEDGSVLREKKLGLEPRSSAAMGGRLFLVHGDRGRRIVVLDDEDLAPVWAARSRRPVARLIASAHRLVAISPPLGDEEDGDGDVVIELFDARPPATRPEEALRDLRRAVAGPEAATEGDTGDAPEDRPGAGETKSPPEAAGTNERPGAGESNGPPREAETRHGT